MKTENGPSGNGHFGISLLGHTVEATARNVGEVCGPFPPCNDVKFELNLHPALTAKSHVSNFLFQCRSAGHFLQ